MEIAQPLTSVPVIKATAKKTHVQTSVFPAAHRDVSMVTVLPQMSAHVILIMPRILKQINVNQNAQPHVKMVSAHHQTSAHATQATIPPHLAVTHPVSLSVGEDVSMDDALPPMYAPAIPDTPKTLKIKLEILVFQLVQEDVAMPIAQVQISAHVTMDTLKIPKYLLVIDVYLIVPEVALMVHVLHQTLALVIKVMPKYLILIMYVLLLVNMHVPMAIVQHQTHVHVKKAMKKMLQI